MKKRLVSLMSTCAIAMLPLGAHATNVSGQVVRVEGHIMPACRRLHLKTADGTMMVFRTPETQKEDGILAVAMTALTSGLKVDINYTDGTGTGCGTEPAVLYITLLASGQ